MPIYLVRWPDLSASLVRARDEDNHRRIQEARPGEPVTPDQVVVEDVGRMATEPVVEAMELSLAGEDGCDTGMAILSTAFPRLHGAVEKLQESDDELASEGVVPEATLREVLDGELVRRLQWSWRHAGLLRLQRFRVSHDQVRAVWHPEALREGYERVADDLVVVAHAVARIGCDDEIGRLVDAGEVELETSRLRKTAVIRPSRINARRSIPERSGRLEPRTGRSVRRHPRVGRPRRPAR